MEHVNIEEPENLLDILTQHLYNTFDLDIWRTPTLIAPREPLTQRTDLHIPDFGEQVTVDQMEDMVYWSFELPDEVEGSVSFTSSERITPARNKYKIRHDFVAETFTMEGTDRPLGEEIERLGDDDDRLTPDILVRDIQGTIYIIEIGTSRSPYEESLRRSFREKMFKYEMPIRNRRLNNPIIYLVVIVGLDCIISNVQLPQQIVDELIIRMKIGVALEDVAKGKGINLTSDETDSIRSQIMNEILFQIEQIGPKDLSESEHLNINSQYIEDIKQDPVESEALKVFSSSMERAREDIIKAKEIRKSDLIKQYIGKLPKQTESRMDPKAVVQWPFLIIRRHKPSIDIPKFILSPGSKGEYLQKIWSHAFMSADKGDQFKAENQAELKSEALETNPEKVKAAQERRHKMRSHWHRVNMKPVLSSEVLHYLNKDGLFAKSAKASEAMKARKKQQKLPFWFETPTTDIDNFISDSTLFDEHGEDLIDSEEFVIQLIKRAEELSENPGLGENFISEWMKTKLFDSVNIMSDIGYELAASIKQNTNSNEFILKKLRNYPVYLLIKPTNSQSHLFFSIFIPDFEVKKLYESTVFRGLHKLSRGYATDFVSIRISKIQNMANASATLLTLASFWSDFFGLPDALPHDFRGHKEAQKMLLFTLLVSLEDKAQTEEVITMSRYMYMEIFKGTVNIKRPNPFKVLSKFPLCIRTRLCLWVIKALMQNFGTMVDVPPSRAEVDTTVDLQEDEDALPGDEWTNLLNCFSGTRINSATAAVNLMYIGYFKNKNEAAEGNVEWKMLEKILEEEFEVDPKQREKYYGRTNPEEPIGKKQFNKNSIVFGCKLLEDRLHKQLGPDWKRVLETEISDSLSRHLTHEIATLKASSICNHKDTKKECTRETNKRVWRVKVIEAIACKLGLTKLNPMVQIGKLLKFVEESSAGVICDLFKKNQHGGLREIYVLTIESRLIQLFIETISRTICSHFEEETLTHPTNKLKILDNHKVRTGRLSRKMNSTYADFCSSSDKTRWNQNFIMTAMVIPLVRLTTEKFHNVIYRCMNLWANKLIKIPHVVQNLLLSKIPLSSETYSELLNKFWTTSKVYKNKMGMNRRKGQYLNLTTGMMQGILHYTSSLLHLTYLTSFKYFSLKYLKVAHPSHKFLISQVCSSDDSATILTVMTESDKDRISKEDVKAFFECDIVLEANTYFCNAFCMRESDKSTTSVYDYVEFNSEFLFKNTLAIPTIKFVAACLNMTESESFVNRFYTMYNLISDLSASGMPFMNTYYCQIAQALQHYKSLGLSMNVLFGDYAEMVIAYPNPVYGFFLLDNHRCCGALGYSFSRWLAFQNSKTFSERLSVIQYEEVETIPDGGVVSSLMVKHGDLKRWNTMMDRIESANLEPKQRAMQKHKVTGETIVDKEIVENRRERINRDPELFFRHPNTESELQTKLLIKASMPGVANSLGKGNPFIQALALSVYAINTHSFTRTTTKKVFDAASGSMKVEKRTRKLSLLLALKEYSETKGLQLTAEEEANLLEQAFPLRTRYDQALSVIRSYENSDWVNIHRLRNRKTFLVIQPRISTLPVTLQRVCAKWWFGHSIRTSENVFRKCLTEYQLTYPWLTGTFQETLAKSPFSNPIELYNFISTQESKSRKYMYYGPAVRSLRFTGQMTQLIKRGYKRGCILQRDPAIQSEVEKTDKLISSFSLSLLIPDETQRKKRASHSLYKISEKYEDIQDIATGHKREMTLALMSMKASRKASDMDVVNFVRKMNNGILITFTKEQKRVIKENRVEWEGDGECIVNGEGNIMRIVLRDRTATRIYVKDFRNLRRNPGVMISIFDQLGVRSDTVTIYQPRCVARFNGTTFVSSEGSGTPIIIDQEIEDIFSDPPNLKIKISQSKSGIYYDIKGRELSLVEFRTSFRDISLYTGTDTSRGIWHCWTNQLPLHAGEAYAFLEEMSNALKDPSRSPFDKENLSNWISNTLTSRLKYRRIGYAQEFYTQSVAESEINSEESYDEEIERLLVEMQVGGQNSMVSNLFGVFQQDLVESTITNIETNPSVPIDEIEQLINIDFDNLLQHEFKYSPFRALLTNYVEEIPSHSTSVMRRDVFSYLYLHPLWDNLIDSIIVNEADFFTKLLQGIVSAKNQELSNLMMGILNIKKKDVELNITQRFRQFSSLKAEEDLEFDPFEDLD
uniref:RNA-directed RNA polymerase L n=1 Tax=Macrotermes natalensis phenuivirus 1 TaxID=3133464 RepID=A0AAT9JAF3_9VIRU